ncbi:MAG: hypothetical protein IJK93_09540 [Muribaculaceae bacterium]|nr:hypothetical protein [Muribaculaceae bacterium]
MKKIYILTAVFALLTLSLNAQTRAVETNTYTYTLPNSNAFSTSGGNATLGDFTWTYSSFTYRGWENTRGMQIGSRNNPTSTFTLSTSEIPGTITSITVGANAYNANATIRATVGGAAFGTTQNLSSGNSAATNTFTGSASGEIVITWTNVNNGRAMYFKSIEVTYEVDDPNTANLDLFSNTTDENMCLPVYGGYHDHTQHNQMVYPASLLTDMVGKKIKSMTFYPASVTYNGTTYSGIGFRNGSVTFKMMEVTGSTGFDSSNPSFITGSMTTVKTVTMPSTAQTSATTWKITFDQEYEYNGGDLVIDVTNATGDYQRTYFYTGTTSIAYPGYYTYSGSTGSASVAVDYVPKVTFTYEYDLNKTATPTITYVVNADNVVITATGDGTVTLTVGNQTVSGNGSASITIPRTDTTYSVTATATAQESGKDESDPATETITIPFLQTAAPSISVSEPDANGNVVVTATGDGTVYLSTSDGQSVSGNGSVSITLPQQAHDYTVTAEAYAQESGKAASTTVTESVTVLGKIDDTWKEMTGTYTNDNDVLSFLTKVNGDTIDIMMVDQFKVSTLNNDHPDHYTYVMTETINGEDKYSNEVAIPVYKTNSSIQGLYTQGQVDTLDLKMGLRANVVNTKMDYDVNPDHNVLYYSLYRSDLDATYPEITVDSRISQLQKFDDNSTGTVQYYMFENHPTGVAPRYDHLGNEIAERLDTNWVECDFGQKLAYVPVIWTFGLYSGREDGKNNSYGSDIKREELGAVTVTVEGKHSDGSSMGKFTYDGVEYCIYHPVFNIEGAAPQTITQGDGDECTYVPYMYRAWCTYEGMRDYTADENGLKDNGPLAAPYLLGEEVTTNSQCHIGKNWTQGDGRLQNGFAIPTSVPDGDVTFIVRFYYKKEVAEAQSNGNKLRLGNGEGEEYFIAQAPADGDSMVTGISELMNGVTPVSVTYVNTQGMKSDKPFDGVNIVVTRYSDGSTVTSKIIR